MPAPNAASCADDCLLVYITVPDRAAAESISQALVSERLAACANIVDSVTSLYWWQGVLEGSSECVCILKTTRDRYGALEVRARELHAYDVPCIVALPIVCGNADFFDWIRAETRPRAMA